MKKRANAVIARMKVHFEPDWTDTLCGCLYAKRTRKREKVTCRICLKYLAQMDQEREARKRRAAEGAAALAKAYPWIFG